MSLDSAQVRELLRASWPGNVRQLVNEVERAVILGQGSRPAFAAGPSGVPAGPAVDANQSPVTLDDSIAQAIATALRAAGGKIYGSGGAAERLDVKPSTLQAKMAKLSLRRADFTS